MDREFFVVALETCDECGGSGFVLDPDWAEYSSDYGDPVMWFQARGLDVRKEEDLPPEEILCDVCNGEGRRRLEVPLAEALKEILS